MLEQLMTDRLVNKVSGFLESKVYYYVHDSQINLVYTLTHNSYLTS